ncbi:MAG: DUF2958 domain-containing protein [Methanobacterium paludis]|nr:DUF2958 domain-containing protein [Methanobacterium paludis]
MKLLTKRLESRIPKLYGTEHIPVEEKIVQVKYFLPGTGWSWLGVEYDPEQKLFFGYVKSGLDESFSEWGYFSLTELESIGRPFRVERDLYFTPKEFGKLKKGLDY